MPLMIRTQAMTARKIISNATALLYLLCILNACAAFRHPLPNSQSIKTDPRLKGAWVLQSDQDKVFVHVAIRHETEHILAYVEYGNDEFEGLHTALGTATVSQIDGDRFLNLRAFESLNSSPPLAGESARLYHIIKYDLQQDELKLWVADPVVLKSAVKDGVLRGSVSGKSCPEPEAGNVSGFDLCEAFRDAEITDSGENVARFIKAHEAELFAGQPALFTRLNPSNIH